MRQYPRKCTLLDRERYEATFWVLNVMNTLEILDIIDLHPVYFHLNGGFCYILGWRQKCGAKDKVLSLTTPQNAGTPGYTLKESSRCRSVPLLEVGL